MWLEKDGIRVNPQHPADVAKLKALGYQAVAEPLPAPLPKPVPAPAPLTPEQANVEAIQDVNESPKSKGKR